MKETELYVVDYCQAVAATPHSIKFIVYEYDPLSYYNTASQMFTDVAAAWIPRHCILGIAKVTHTQLPSKITNGQQTSGEREMLTSLFTLCLPCWLAQRTGWISKRVGYKTVQYAADPKDDYDSNSCLFFNLQDRIAHIVNRLIGV